MIGYIVLGCLLWLSLFFNCALLVLAFQIAHRADEAEVKLREVSANRALDEVYDALRDSKRDDVP